MRISRRLLVVRQQEGLILLGVMPVLLEQHGEGPVRPAPHQTRMSNKILTLLHEIQIVELLHGAVLVLQAMVFIIALLHVLLQLL